MFDAVDDLGHEVFDGLANELFHGRQVALGGLGFEFLDGSGPWRTRRFFSGSRQDLRSDDRPFRFAFIRHRPLRLHHGVQTFIVLDGGISPRLRLGVLGNFEQTVRLHRCVIALARFESRVAIRRAGWLGCHLDWHWTRDRAGHLPGQWRGGGLLGGALLHELLEIAPVRRRLLEELGLFRGHLGRLGSPDGVLGDIELRQRAGIRQQAGRLCDLWLRRLCGRRRCFQWRLHGHSHRRLHAGRLPRLYRNLRRRGGFRHTHEIAEHADGLLAYLMGDFEFIGHRGSNQLLGHFLPLRSRLHCGSLLETDFAGCGFLWGRARWRKSLGGGEQVLHGIDETGRLQRFGDQPVGSGAAAFLGIVGLHGADDEQHRDSFQLVVGLDIVADLVAILARHEYISDDQLRQALLQGMNGGLTVRDGRDLMAFRRKNLLPHPLRVGTVIGEQYLCQSAIHPSEPSSGLLFIICHREKSIAQRSHALDLDTVWELRFSERPRQQGTIGEIRECSKKGWAQAPFPS